MGRRRLRRGGRRRLLDVHQVIIGRTKTGKTTLAKKLGAEYLRQSCAVIAYNPLGNHDFIRPDVHTGRVAASAEHVSAEAFLAAVDSEIRRSTGRPTILIVDEATTFFRKQNCPREWLATRGRHSGIQLIIIAQHYANLNVSVRSQAERLSLFKCGLTTAAMCADEYGEPTLKDARGLKPGHFWQADLKGLRLCRVF